MNTCSVEKMCLWFLEAGFKNSKNENLTSLKASKNGLDQENGGFGKTVKKGSHCFAPIIESSSDGRKGEKDLHKRTAFS